MGGEKRTSVELWTRGRVHVTLEGEHGGIGGGGKKWQFGFPGTDNTDGQGGGDFALMRKDGEKRR